MGVLFKVSIGYRSIFEDYDTVSLSDLIKDIPTKNSLEIISYFLAQIHTSESDSTLQLEFLKIWASRLPLYVNERINNFIERVSKKQNAQYDFLNNISGLILIEKLIENDNGLPMLSALTLEQELNFFKAFLFCSQQWIDKQLPSFNTPKNPKEEDLIKTILTTQLPYQEVSEFKDFRIQFLKAVYFFKFCEQDSQFKIYLSIFLNEYGLKSWQEYLFHLTSLYVRKFEKMKTPSVMNVPANLVAVIQFLDDLSINPSTFKGSDDFLSLREKPVYKIDTNNFIFLNLNFLVDKIYQGIQFDFARILVKNLATFKGKVIKNVPAFLGIFGNEFSETGLFYSVMNYVFEKTNYLKFTGERIKTLIGDGAPDYYLRDKAKVYVFEFKNIVLAADVKHSNNYDLIVGEIFKKLVSNQNNSSKGVTQLVDVILKIRSKEFNKFDDYDFDKSIIYPIIVYTDISFNLGGMNYLLNKEFTNQLTKRGISNTSSIKNLILIQIDDLIKFQDLFRDKKLKLNNCSNEYYELLLESSDIFNRIVSFNMFIHEKTRKMDYETPKMLHEEITKILPSEGE